MIRPETLFRFQRWLREHRLTALAKAVKRLNKLLNAIDIGINTEIGRGFRIHHGVGLVIGDAVQIGNGFTCFQGVTIGRRSIRKKYRESEQIAPIIGNHVIVYTGAVVIGDIRIGDGVVIGANAVVMSDVPANIKIPAGTIWNGEVNARQV